jgi:hypothetical protein
MRQGRSGERDVFRVYSAASKIYKRHQRIGIRHQTPPARYSHNATGYPVQNQSALFLYFGLGELWFKAGSAISACFADFGTGYGHSALLLVFERCLMPDA